MVRLRAIQLLSIALLVALPSSGAPQQKPQQQQPPPSPPTQQQIDSAIDRGAQFLLKNYAQRVATDRIEAQERVGLSALSLYTMLKAGISRDDDVVRRLLTNISMQRIDNTYDATCLILALYAHDETAHFRWISTLARQLVDWQAPKGDWSYPAGGGDLSNTQYAALGLWVATKAGVHVDKRVWSDLATAALDYQTKDGGFSYTASGPGARGSTGSMTAAGIGTLAICELELRIAGACPAVLGDELGNARRRGLDWLTQRFDATTNPLGGGWRFYYLYGLERMGALTGVVRLGPHDWYTEGATQLVAEQHESGAWNRGDDLSDTCFAILFLRRATAARGPATGVPAAESDAIVHVMSAGDGAVKLWIDGWNQKIARTLEWPGERGKGARVTRVEYLADDKVVAVQLGDPSRANAGEHFNVTHIFDSVGKHRVKARVYVLMPNEKAGSEQPVESQELEVEVSTSLPGWAGEIELNMGRNLVDDAKPKAKATSVVPLKSAPLGLAFDADLAIDGNPATPWLADPKDEHRTLTISFNKAAECTAVRISPAVLPAFGTDYLSRGIELEVTVNGSDKRRITLDPDPLHPITFELEHKVPVKRIDVHILSIAPSESSACVGIGEVELFSTKK